MTTPYRWGGMNPPRVDFLKKRRQYRSSEFFNRRVKASRWKEHLEREAASALQASAPDEAPTLTEEELLAPVSNPRTEFFMEFAKAVGIEPRCVTSLVIRLEPGIPFPQVEVHSVPPDDAGQAAAQVLQKFNLVARPEGCPQVVGSLDKSASLMTSEEMTHRVADSPAETQPGIGAPLPATGSTPLGT